MRLTEDELDVLKKITYLSKMDCWFSIEHCEDGDEVYDIEEDSVLSLEDGIATLQEGMTSYSDYDMDNTEITVFKELLEKLNIEETL